MLGELDQALVSTDFKDRCRTAYLILIRCWPDIRSFMEECEERAASESTSGAGTEDLIKALAAAMTGSSTESSGTTDPVPCKLPPPSGAPTAKSRAATAKLAAESAEEEAPGEDGPPSEETSEQEDSPEPEAMPAVETDTEESPESTSLPDMVPGGQSDDEMPSGFHQSVSETETGRMDLENTDTVSAPEDEAYAGTGYSGAASDIARVLETMAENSVCAELERQRTKELTELAQSISYTRSSTPLTEGPLPPDGHFCPCQ